VPKLAPIADGYDRVVWLADGVLYVLLVLTIGGCGALGVDPQEPAGPKVEIATGDAVTGPWTAWIYTTSDGSLCQQFEWVDGRGDSSCGHGAGAFVTTDPDTTFVMGGTGAVDAASVRITLDTGDPVVLELVTPAPGVSDGVRFYATSLDGGPIVMQIDVLDATGIVIESEDIGPVPRRPDPRSS
jgi:hypothetical protein